MRRLALMLAAPAALLLTAAGPPEWPHKEDIPVPAPVSVGLAGAEEIDVTRYFLANGPRRAGLSPDGKTVVYSSNITGEQQAWVVSVDGGAPRQLTFGLGVDGVLWTPEGDILYASDKGGDERLGFFTVTPDGTRERVIVPQSEGFIFFGDFTSDGRLIYASTARNGRDFDLYSADVKGGGTKLLAQGRLGLYPAGMQPKGDLMLAYEALSENSGEVSVIDLKTGKERGLLKPGKPTNFDSFAWTPDGKGFYLVTDQDREFTALAHYDLANGQMKIVEAPSYDVVSTVLSGDGRYLVWITDEGGFHTLHGKDLQTGKALVVPKLQPGVYSIEFARKAPVLGIHVNGPTTPGEAWVWDLASGKAKRVIEPNAAGLDLSKMAMPTVVRFKARDGTPLSGLLYRPLGVKGPVPVYLSLHGGPTSHARATWKPAFQYLLARGYAVLDFNYRGSTGSGKTLASLNDKRLRVNEMGDVLDAVAWIKTQPGLDGSRVAVGGGSYGGYLTNAVMGAHPGVFVAGVSEVGVADWVKNLEEASPSLKASDRGEYGDIDDPSDRAFLASISPINNADKIRDPLLIQVGANDPRNGVVEQDMYVTAIRKAGRKVIYMRYADQGHQMSNLANIVHFNRAKAAFLEEAFKSRK